LKTGSNLAEFSKDGYGTKCAVLPMMMNLFLSKLTMDFETAFNSLPCKAYKIEKNRSYLCS
jgi:hypothetical protein